MQVELQITFVSQISANCKIQVALQISKKHKKKDSSPHLLWLVTKSDTDGLSYCVDGEDVELI